MKTQPLSFITRAGLMLATAALLVTTARTRAETPLTPVDSAFLLAADQRGMAEVTLGELAAQNGMRDEVKALGQLVAKERAAINTDLKALAVKRGLTLPEGLASEKRAAIRDMAALKGQEFDDAYLAAMTKQLAADVKDFNATVADTQDTDLKYLLDKSILVLVEHAKRVAAISR